MYSNRNKLFVLEEMRKLFYTLAPQQKGGATDKVLEEIMDDYRKEKQDD